MTAALKILYERYHADEAIQTLDDLEDAALRREAVIVPGHPAWGTHKPAAWMLRLSGATLLQLFREGMYVYVVDPDAEEE